MKMKWKKIKRKLRYNKKRSFLFIFLACLACSVGIGYATLQTELKIDGTSKFQEATWDVHFNNLVVDPSSITATTPADITNDTTVVFAARLEDPGDLYEFNVDVVNGGSLNAMLDGITITPELTAAQQEYLEYTVTYSDGTPLALKHKLDANSTETLTVHFAYKDGIDTSLYPEDDENFTVSVQLTYVQADSSAINVPHS